MKNELPTMEATPDAITWEEAFGEPRGPDIALKDIGKNMKKIKRLFENAAQGGPGGCSGYQRARKLAGMMSRAIEECAGTDLDVVEGAALLMCYAATGGGWILFCARFAQ